MGKLNKIIVHWTAGHTHPCEEDLNAYHFVVDGDGLIHTCYHEPEDNIDCKDGNYAQHCGGGNTGAIGVAACGMWGYNDSTRTCKDSKDMLTHTQMEALFAWVAYLCKKYSILPKQVLTHAEFGKAHPKSSSAGKIDINIIPWDNVYGIKETGDYIRNKVQWYYERLK